MSAPEYRTPEELQAQEQQHARVRAVLDRAVHDGASFKLAAMFGEPPEVAERWVNTLWDGLRDNLSDDRPDMAGLRQEDRLTAIALLLDERINAEVDSVLRSVGGPR